MGNYVVFQLWLKLQSQITKGTKVARESGELGITQSVCLGALMHSTNEKIH